MPTPKSAHPRPAFIIGITGNTDPVGYANDPKREEAAAAAIRARIRAILQWVKSRKGWLDPVSGEFHPGDKLPKHIEPCWQALGLVRTPVHVLSSLAPGVDTIAADAALDYAAEYNSRAGNGEDFDRAAGIRVRAPLPFPVENPDPATHRMPEEGGLYALASTFKTGGHTDPAKVARLQRMLARLRAQDGFAAERDLFCVALDNDLEGDPNEDLEAIDKTFQKPRRHLRYRAAGEFIATHSDLLIAIHDKDFDQADPANLFESGTATIIEVKRHGLTYELLAIANNFSWADNGPVLRIPVRRDKNKGVKTVDGVEQLIDGSPISGGAARMEFLHPIDLFPLPGAPDDDKEWQQEGDKVFRKILERQEELNGLKPHGKERREHGVMLHCLNGKCAPLVTNAAAKRFAAPLATLAAVRRRTAAESRKTDDHRKSVHRNLLCYIGFTALLSAMFEHWHRAGEHGPGHDGEFPWITIRGVLLAGALLWLFLSARKYFRYSVEGHERRRHDYRAIGEGLRVQYYWCLTGTGCAVSADYMQRQRNELDWIRYVIASLTFPFESWRRGFLKLSDAARLQLLKVARRNWIQEQLGYFDKQARELHGKHAFWHQWGWTCGAAALISFILMLCGTVWADFDKCMEAQPLVVPFFLFLAGNGTLSLRERVPSAVEGDQAESMRESGFIGWIVRNTMLWGFAFALSGLALGLAHVLGRISVLPDWHNWWIILTGGILLPGGLFLVWSERQLYSETSRQYRAMRALFACADFRMGKLLERLATMQRTNPGYDRLLAEIHDLIHELGCEALDENAEWLILHRARPLEPFMAP